MPYERLLAWRACHELWIGIHRATASWPVEERFGLVAQLRRAALSASSNVAEGAARKGSKDFARFLNIALGSLSEVSCQLRGARDLGFVDGPEFARLDALQQTAGKLTMGLYQAMRKHHRS